MKPYFIKHLFLVIILTVFGFSGVEVSKAQRADGQFINGDALPDAPELALSGEYKTGVRTIEIVHKDQIDILKTKDGVEPLYDRKLKLEVWYPAVVPAGSTEIIEYEETRGNRDDPKKPFIQYSFSGRALREGTPDANRAPFPLIIVSHGYVGSRLLMTYLTENLASKGYIVVSIDHMESTYQDAGGFQSTLLNRSHDILFVLEQVAEMGKTGSGSFLSGQVDANNTALIGYSMGPGLPFDFYYHYAEPAWDQRRINNINQHFVTAFLGINLKKADFIKFFEFDPGIKVWPGFKARTSVGLELLHSVPVK